MITLPTTPKQALLLPDPGHHLLCVRYSVRWSDFYLVMTHQCGICDQTHTVKDGPNTTEELGSNCGQDFSEEPVSHSGSESLRACLDHGSSTERVQYRFGDYQ